MMRSMFSGVTGLRNHQVRMDVIGNNIANVNTVGFKKSRVVFQDTLSQTMRGASSPQGNRGGTNPMQVGLGMTIASIDTLHSPSSAESTGNMTDLAIEGEGYFMLGDGLDTYYTRAGNFDFDRNGTLINRANGLKVQGWQTDDYRVPDDKSPQDLGDIVVRKGMVMQAKATDSAKFGKNLDDNEPIFTEKYTETDDPHNDPTKTEYDNYTIPFKVYDSKGNGHTLTIGFRKTSANNWDYRIYADRDNPNTTAGTGKLEFGANGYITNGAQGTFTLEPGNGASDLEDVPIDFSQVTQFAKETNIDLTNQSGYPAGILKEVTIDTAGVITGAFDNGLSVNLAQIALANFDNPGGLIKAGQNMYRYSNNSGEPQIGESGTSGRGAIAPGYLEMSNVDLSEEFTQMIVTQRGFQANSRIITASDEMLQELVNLKR